MDYKKEIIESPKIGEKYIRIKHPCGCTVCLYPMEGFSTAQAMLGVNFGSVDAAFKTDGDSDFVTVPDGTAHYLEHKMFECKEYNAFEQYSKTGAYANAFTSFDKTTYIFSCSQDFEKNLEILLNTVQEPYFTDETVAKEQGIIGQEIDMYRDDPSWRVFFNCLQAVYYNNPVRLDIAGTAESIARIDKDLLYRCYGAFYDLNNTVLAIAGNFNADKALEICDRLLKKSPPVRLERFVPDEPYEVREKSVTEKLSCAKPLFYIMYKFPAMTAEEAAHSSIVYSLLFFVCLGATSSFYTEMYEQGLINASFNIGIHSGRGFFAVSINGESDEPAMVKDRVNSELKRLKTDLPSREDFENVKKSFYGSMIGGFGSVSGVANALLNSEMNGLSLFDSINITAGITYDDIVEALNKMDIDNCSISVVEPAL
ncbi:MAG: insulinase family protein [Firmicutes bacterium]|nr:insulinase family protein [Bacillota bacterium]